MTLWNAEGLKPIGYLVWPLRSLKVRNPFLTLTWPGDLTFGDLGLTFLHKVSNSIVSRYWKNGGAARRRFPAIREKPEGWAFSAPPPPSSARVKGRVSTDIGNMELWARGWSIYFSELTVSFKPQGKFFNSLYFEHPWAESAMTYYRLHPKHISQHYKQKRKPQQRYYR